MRRPIMAANWKMNKTITEALNFLREFSLGIKEPGGMDIVICPSFTALYSVGQELEGTGVKLGAQNMYWEKSGAFTGEVSPVMLDDAGCEYVILGHSERRHIFKESDEMVNRKVKSAVVAGLKPIICVGETLDQREQEKTFSVIEEQIRGALKDIPVADLKETVIAYEPVWAIGTGKTASPEQAQEVHRYIRKLLGEICGGEFANAVRIQYGGSTKPENIKSIMLQPDVDGALVGGAGLEPDSFLKMIQEVSASEC